MASLRHALAPASVAVIDASPDPRSAGRAAAVLGQTRAARLLPGPVENARAVPAYAYPESAARALGHAARYGTWRGAQPEPVSDLEPTDAFLRRLA